MFYFVYISLISRWDVKGDENNDVSYTWQLYSTVYQNNIKSKYYNTYSNPGNAGFFSKCCSQNIVPLPLPWRNYVDIVLVKKKENVDILERGEGSL